MVDIKVCLDCGTAKREHLFKQQSCQVCGGQVEVTSVPRTKLFFVQLGFLLLSMIFVVATVIMLIQYNNDDVLTGRWFEVVGVFIIALSFGIFAIGIQIKESKDLEEAAHDIWEEENAEQGVSRRRVFRGSGRMETKGTTSRSRRVMQPVRTPTKDRDEIAPPVKRKALPPSKDDDEDIPTRYPKGLDKKDQSDDDEWAEEEEDTIIKIPPTRGKRIGEVKAKNVVLDNEDEKPSKIKGKRKKKGKSRD